MITISYSRNKITESSEMKDTPYFKIDQPFEGKNLRYVNQQVNFKLDGWLEAQLRSGGT